MVSVATDWLPIAFVTISNYIPFSMGFGIEFTLSIASIRYRSFSGVSYGFVHHLVYETICSICYVLYAPSVHCSVTHCYMLFALYSVICSMLHLFIAYLVTASFVGLVGQCPIFWSMLYAPSVFWSCLMLLRSCLFVHCSMHSPHVLVIAVVFSVGIGSWFGSVGIAILVVAVVLYLLPYCSLAWIPSDDDTHEVSTRKTPPVLANEDIYVLRALGRVMSFQ